MPTIDNWRALRDALEAGPTDGPFYADGARADLHAVRVKHPTMVGAVFADVGYSGSTKQDTINAEYIAAAHPAAIRSLLAERDRLAAEVEALRADAGRYRWLRHGDNDAEVMVFDNQTRASPENVWLPRLDELDAAIDAALIESGRKLVDGGPDDLLKGV